ncbi:MAG: hypothetical protein A2Z20_06030 [Bdellovibrionales bacterium RBG_16_40_8]|nr:MAG: hypothetical protein A2Z20_06030 [Bdellovibrionales bacterium RBG_16_40_8]
MHSLKQIMEQIGFDKDAPIETQKAFIRHLISRANDQSVAKKKQKVPQKNETKICEKDQQLEFVFNEDKQVS